MGRVGALRRPDAAARPPYQPRSCQIRFTTPPQFRQPRRVAKSLAVFVSLLTTLSCVRAQEQENKLVDRLLRPNMTLQNSGQNKKFIADGAPVNKRDTVGAFYVQKKSRSKSFSGTRDFSTQQFNPPKADQSFHAKRSAFEISSQQAIGNSRSTYVARSARGVRDAPQSNKRVASHSYVENRPFLDQGKSQKSLNRQNAPLTIEQVRELLNKNK